MKPKKKQPIIFNSLSELNKALGIGKPLHPLVTISNLYEAEGDLGDISNGVMLNFYQIAFKKYYRGSIKYGQKYYDFAEGGISFIAPNQLMASGGDEEECEGETLMFHPDFLSGSALATSIKNYNFFSYNANEALQLSENEKATVMSIFDRIKYELGQRIDEFSQKVVISEIELLLNYSDRFYNRQFITRKAVNNDLLSKMDALLEQYFDSEMGLKSGLPTVSYLADKLSVSPGYLSDMLRSLTGLNAQQHIHLKIIEKAKQYLSGQRLSISEIAYKLGFEHPQSFTKLFKNKTNMSPAHYRQSLN